MPVPARSPRRLAAWIAGGLFLAATAAVIGVLGVSTATSGAGTVLIGSLDERSLLSIAVVVALVSLGVGLWSIGAPRWMLPLKIIGVVLAVGAGVIAAFLAVLVVEANVSPVLHEGCDTGYVVVERSFLMGSSGTVYRQDGLIIATAMGRTSGDDGYQPFATGGYAVSEAQGSLTITYAINRPYEGMDTASAALGSITVPVLAGRTPQCGIDAGGGKLPSPGPAAPSSEPDPVTAASVDHDMRELIDASFAAASGTVVDATGTPIYASALPMPSVPCTDDSGVRREVAIEFRTDDNAKSLAQILAVWDQRGYEKDRAMHEDIRFSENRPVARMSVKDTSSIDGLIRLSASSVCVPAE